MSRRRQERGEQAEYVALGKTPVKTRNLRFAAMFDRQFEDPTEMGVLHFALSPVCPARLPARGPSGTRLF
jgi:hypothetical protein